MSDRLADAFDFRGRLGRSAKRRLELKPGVILVLATMTPIALLIGGAPRAWAWLPFLAVPPAGAAFLAASIRRLHDVGLSARMEFFRRAGFLVMALGPLAAAILMPDLPETVWWLLIGFSAVTFIVAVGRDLAGGRPEWGPGDPGPNRYGPPPE